MNRKTNTMAAAVVAAIVVTAASACGGSTGSKASAQGTTSASSGSKVTSLVMTNTGGDWGKCQRDKFFNPFTAKTGIKVMDGSFVNDGQIEAMAKTGEYTQDVIYPSPALAASSTAGKYLDPINYSLINKANLAPGTYTKYGVSIDIYSWVLGYRSDKFGSNPPKSWADFFDVKKFPGKRALPGDIDPAAILYAALLASGVSPSHLAPIDVQRALKELDKIKSQIVWYSSGSQGQQLLKSGEVAMGIEYANRVAGMPNAAITWNGQIVAGDLVGVPKGDPKTAAAMRLISFITSTPVNGTFTYCASGAPSNIHSATNPSATPTLPTSHLNVPYVQENSQQLAGYFAAHETSITTAFNNWRGKS